MVMNKELQKWRSKRFSNKLIRHITWKNYSRLNYYLFQQIMIANKQQRAISPVQCHSINEENNGCLKRLHILSIMYMHKHLNQQKQTLISKHISHQQFMTFHILSYRIGNQIFTTQVVDFLSHFFDLLFHLFYACGVWPQALKGQIPEPRLYRCSHPSPLSQPAQPQAQPGSFQPTQCQASNRVRTQR